MRRKPTVTVLSAALLLLAAAPAAACPEHGAGAAEGALTGLLETLANLVG